MQADITYTRDTGEKLVNETFGPNNIRRRMSGAEERHRMEIANGREAGALALDANGFVLVEHRTAVRDFFDAEELKRVYYPEVVALIQRVAGASRVVVFDHTLRSRSAATPTGWGRPIGSNTAHATAGSISPRCAVRRRSFSRCTTRRRTDVRA